jgi:hypothetical protein
MRVVIEYFKLIDLLALLALAVLAFAALRRTGSAWLFVSGILIAIWGAMRLLGCREDDQNSANELVLRRHGPRCKCL